MYCGYKPLKFIGRGGYGLAVIVKKDDTVYVIKRYLKDKKIKITRRARGRPKGGEIEYADEETLEEAIEGRK